MKTLLKILAWTVGIVVGLVLIAFVVLTLVLDPNDYKDEIVTAVKDATGRELKIDGDLSWTLYPWLGVKAAGLTLGNARGFGPQPFAKIGAAGASVELVPLFSGRIGVDTVHVRDVTLNLAKDARGRSNWDDLANAKAPAPKTPPTKKPAEPGTDALGAFAIGGVDIQGVDLNYHDAAEDTRFAARDVSLRTGRFAFGSAVDTRLVGTLEYGKPARQTKLALRTKLTLSENAAALRDLDMKVDDSTLTGAIEIVDLKKTALRFDLALDSIDLDRYLEETPASETAKQGTATPPAAAPIALPVSALRALNAKGKLRIGRLKATGIRSSDIAIQLSAVNGLLRLGPNSAKLYEGRYSGTTALDVRGNTPQLTLNEKLEQVQLGPFLHDADLFDAFSGAGNIELKLTAAGFDAKAITRTLDGTVAVAIKEGAIEGIDLAKIDKQIKEARRKTDDDPKKLAGELPTLKPEKGDKTTFSKLGASAVLVNGIATNKDLAIETHGIRVNGKGRADLVKEKFDDYVLMLGEVPLVIDGPFTSPRIRPDWNAIAKKAVEKKVEKEKKEVERKLEKKKKKLEEQLRDRLRLR